MNFFKGKLKFCMVVIASSCALLIIFASHLFSLPFESSSINAYISNTIGFVLASFSLFSGVWVNTVQGTKKELERSKESLKLESETDHLTRQGNRKKFYGLLREEVESSKPFTLLSLDLDKFQEINETYGHTVGDLLLIGVSRRISKVLGEFGFVSRIGSDEFMIILPNTSAKKDIEETIELLRNTINKVFMIKNIQIKITTSLGITRYPEDAHNIEQLVANVDQSMYYSKKKGRNCHSYFNQAMQKEVQYKKSLIKDLRVAVYKRQFELYYQPIVDFKSNTIIKAEALIRWNHPQRGFVSPAEFIPVAEEIGLINEIGEWAFKKAVDHTAIIYEHFDKEFQISINTSPLQYHRNGMNVSKWFRYIESRGLSGKNVVFEITEGLLMQKSQAVVKNLLELRDLNIDVAIDDFGTGYSSLSYLKKFDVDFLKIDQSFVKNITVNSDEYILVEAITVMAHRLGIKVIAEGIETDKQKDLLIKAGCDFGQGFYFSKPIRGDDFFMLLEHFNKDSEIKNKLKRPLLEMTG